MASSSELFPFENSASDSDHVFLCSGLLRRFTLHLRMCPFVPLAGVSDHLPKTSDPFGTPSCAGKLTWHFQISSCLKTALKGPLNQDLHFSHLPFIPHLVIANIFFLSTKPKGSANSIFTSFQQKNPTYQQCTCGRRQV